MYINTFLNGQVIEEIKREIKKKIPRNMTNENKTTQNLRDAAKAVPKGTFIAIRSFLKK